MSYESAFAIRSLAINASTFTDISGSAVLPIDCNLVVVFNNSAVDIKLRSDPANSASEVTVPAGQQFEIGAANRLPSEKPRFPGPRSAYTSSPAGSLLSTSGNQTIIIESIL